MVTNPNPANTSYAIYDQYGTYKTIQNNIFDNNTAAGANNYAAYFFSSTGITYDYNDYWVSPGSTYLAYHSSFGTFTPAQWTTFRSVNYGGLNSINIDPLFLSTTNLRHYNVNLNVGNNLLTTVPVDIFGTTRTAPITLGAYEYKPVALDAAAFSLLSNPPCAGVNTVQANIINYGSSALTSATVNWSVNGITQTPFSWTGTLAQSQTSSAISLGTFNFVMNTTYTVLVWTSSPNGGTDGNTANDQISVPTAPALGGVYTIGSTGTYPTFTAAVAALQTYGVCAPVTFQVQPGTYNETITLTQFTGVSSTNTVTFESLNNDNTSVNLTAASTYTVYLNGADWIRFRKLTVTTTAGKCFEFANGATNNIIDSCRVIGYNIASTSTSFYAIGSTNSAATDDNNTIRNNYIRYGSYGVYWYGYSGSPYESGLLFENNTVVDAYNMAAYFLYLNAPVITRNTFDVLSTAYTASRAVQIANLYNATQFTRNNVSGRIYGLQTSSIVGVNGQRAVIANNAITAHQTALNSCYAFYTTSNQYTDILHNSVFSVNPSANSGYTTYAFYDGSSTFTTVQNNIFRDSSTISQYSYAAYFAPSTGTTYDYNDYFVQSGNTYLAYHNSYGNFAPSLWTTFRTVGYGGANSLNINPNWFGMYNLRHRNLTLNAGNNQTTLVPIDFDGQTRTTVVTIGSDEYKLYPNDAGISQVVSHPPCAGVSNVVAQLTNHGSNTLTSVTINWSVNSVAQPAFSWTGSLTTGSSVNVTVGTYNYLSGNYATNISTSNPNGQTDGELTNDASAVSGSPLLTGTFTIGSTGNYSSFSAAVNALSSVGVCGPVVFQVQPGTYTESITLTQVTGASSTNTITFESLNNDSSSVTLTSAAATTILMNGADWIRFRKMTVGATNGKCFDLVNGATNNIIENCAMIGYIGNTTSTAYYVIGSTSTTLNDENNTIRNNYIRYGSYGVYWFGNTTSPYESGLVFENNQVVDAYYMGAYFYYLNAPTITRNTFDVLSSSYTSSFAVRYQNLYNNSVITRNLSMGRLYSAYLASVIGTSSLRALYANNSVVSNQNFTNTCYGLYTSANQYCDILHNSVNTYHQFANNGYSTYSLYEQSSTFCAFQNNIFCDSTAANPYGYAAYLLPSTGTTFDYNDYFVQPGNSNLAYHSSYGSFPPASFATFRNISYGGANSVNIRPNFYDIYNLRHRNTALNVGLNLISTVGVDFDGQTRTTTVTVGADEYKPVANDAGVTQVITTLPCQGVNNVEVRITNYGTSPLTSASILWTVNSVSQTAYSWTGTLASGASTNVIIGTYNFVSGNYVTWVSTSNPNGVTDGDLFNDAVTANIGAALSGSYTIGSSGTYPNFTAAISALSSTGICGPVTFTVQAGTYTENLTIPQINGSSSINRITFQGQSDSTLVVLNSATTYPMNLNGADYFTFRKMTIQTTASTYAIWVQNGAIGNRYENNRIIGFNTTGISSAQSVIFSSSTGVNDMNNEFRNNRIENGSYGIFWQGFTSLPYEQGFIAEGNQLINNGYQGIYLYYMNAPIVRNNFIDNTMNAYTASQGINIQYCYNNTLIFGNDIRSKQYGLYLNYMYGTSGLPAEVENNFINVSVTSGTTIYGIYSFYGDYHNYFHNTVTSTNATTGNTSYTLYDNYGTYKNYQNNIFRNNGPAGSANYSAYLFPSTGSVYNYNDYWVPTGSTYLAYHSSYGNFTPAQSSTFLNNSYGGANSVTIDPVFLSSTNLRHVNGLLNVGVNLLSLVPTDIDGQARFVPVTLGAYDFKSPNDAGATTILNNPPCVGVNTVQAIIANYGTVTLTGATINWTVNSVPQTPFTWTGSVPQGQSSSAISIGTYNFLNSTNYTIVVSTAAPNGGADGNTTNDQVSSTSLPATMSGTYTIGATGSYTTFAAAVSALQTGGICGPVVFNVQNGTYAESITIPQITGANSINTITFQSLNSDSTLVTLTSSSTYPVYMNGADYIIFREMTISTTAATYALFYANTCVGNRVENCRVIGFNTTSTSTLYALVFNNTTSLIDLDNQFLNSRFENGSMGIYWSGYTSIPYEGGMVIEGNQFINQAYYPIYLAYMNAPIIRRNYIDNTMNAYSSPMGMYLQYCYNNTLIAQNDIRTKAYGIYLNYVIGSGSQKVQVYNNFVNVTHPTGTTLYGIYNNYGDNQNIYHNSFSVNNPTAGSTSYVLYDWFGTYKTYANNIFRNISSAGANNYVAYMYPSTGTTFDYNDYWQLAGSTNMAYHSSFGTFTPAMWNTFRTINYGGVNSINVDPQFVSTTNYRHYNPNLNVGLNLLTSVPADFDGRTRTTPITIGAAEFKPVPLDASISNIASPPCSGSSPVQATLANYGTNTLTSSTINWSVNGITQIPYNWTGSLAQYSNTGALSLGTYNFVMNTTYTILVWSSSPNGGSDGNTLNDQSSVVTAPALGGTYTIGSTGNYSTFAAAVSALQTYGVCGPVVFQVQAGIYNETITLPQISTVNSINTITFESLNGDSTSVNLTSASTYTVYVNGGDWYRFRKMTVTSTGGKCFEFANGATNNVIENCSVIGFNIASTSTTYYTIGSNNSVALDENNTIRNNYIRYGSFGIWWYGYSGAPYESGLLVENNVITDAYSGSYFQYLNAPVITRNTFDVLNVANTSSMACRMNNLYNAAQVTRNTIKGRSYGLYMTSLIGTSSLRLMVSNNSVTAHQTSPTSCYALYSSSNQYTDIMHNSVFSVNQFANSGYTTYAFYDGSSSYTTVQNNIFRDSSTISSFSYAAYLIPSTGTTYDYNNYLVESGNTNLAFYNSYGNFSPALWSTFRTVNYGGANSLNVNPTWFNMFNLRHRNLSLNAGLNLITQVAIDIDGQPRTTSVTMGADEYKLYPNDAGISQIVSNPPCLGVNNVVVQLTNYGSNTLTSSTINWSINSVAQPAYSWSGSVATGSSVNVTVGTYNFSSGSFLTAANATLPNSMTDGEPFNDGNAATSFASMNGTYTIGSTGNYTSFNAAVSALSSAGICGPVVFQVMPGTYTETITLTQIQGASSTNTVTFQSQSGDSTSVTLTSASTYTVFVNGADWIRFRKLTIASTGGKVFEFVNGATNNIVENCRLNGYNIASTSTLYYVVGSTNSASFDSNNTIRNNVIRNGSYGVYWYGSSTSPYEAGFVLENNQIMDAYYMNVYLLYLESPIVSGNLIDQRNTSFTNPFTFRVTNLYNNAVITKNRVYGRNYSFYATSINGTTSQRSLIANNSIIAHQTYTGSCYGLYSSSLQYTDILHNNVVTSNDYSTSYSTYAYYDASNAYCTVQNNIFRDSSIASSNSYAAYLQPTTGTTYDYNNYVVNTGNTYLAYHNSYGFFTPGIFTTFRNSAYGGANSVSINPGWYGLYDHRHRNFGLNAGNNQTTLVPSDLYGRTRTSVVTIGAYEFKLQPNDAGITQLVPTPFCPGVNPMQVVVTNLGNNSITGVTINWSVNNVAQTPYVWSGSLAAGSSTVPVVLGTYNFVVGNTYSVSAATVAPNNTIDGDPMNDELINTGVPALSGVYTIGITGDYATFNNALSALISRGVCSPVTFNVASGTYTESITIPSIAGASALNTITFQSASGDSTAVILSASTGNLINLNGADFVRFSRMTLRNTGGIVVNYQNAATRNTINNCYLEGFNSTSTSASYSLIYSNSGTVEDSANIFLNNRMRYGSHAIYWMGNSNLPYEGGIEIEGNTMINQSYMGMYLYYLNAPVIRRNLVDISTSSNTTVYTLFGYYFNNASIVTGNDFRSKSRNVWLSNWTGTSTTRPVIANNFMSVVPNTSTTLYGFYLVSSNFVDVLHNSIHVVNTYGSTVYGLYEASTTQSAFRNNNAVITGSTAGSTYALYASPSTGTSFNYNNYFVPTGTSYLAYHSSFGNFTPGQWTTFQNTSYGGANSTNLNPVFTSNTDLRTCLTQLKAGTYYTIVPTDFDGLPRDNVTPTIGAYEVFVPAAPQNISTTGITCTTTGLGWNPVVGNTNYQVDIATDNSFVNTLSGYTNYSAGNNTVMSVSGLSSGTTYFVRVRSVAACVSGAYSSTYSFTSMNLRDSVVTSTSAPVCIVSSDVTIQTTGHAGVSYQWSGPNGFTSASQSHVFAPVTYGLDGLYTLTASHTGCAPVTDVINLDVNDSIQTISATSNAPLCSGENLSLTSTGGNNRTTYQWTGPGGFTANTPHPVLNSIQTINAGIISVIATSPGCNSVSATHSIHVIPTVPVSVSNNTPLCQGDAIYFSSTFVQGSPYLWTGPNGYSSAQQNPSISQSTPAYTGIYTLMISQPGCNPTFFTSSVVVSQQNNTVALTTNSPVCNTNTLSLSASVISGATYAWTGPNGFTNNTPTVTIPNASPSNSGFYSLIVTNPGCQAINRMLSVLVQPSLVLGSSSNTPVCQGSGLYLSGTTHNLATYNWTGPNGFQSSVQYPAISNTQLTNGGVYTLVVNQPGCGTATTTTVVNVGPTLNGVLITSNSPVCQTQALNLTASYVNGATYTWSGPNGFTSNLDQPTVSNVTTANSGRYSLTISSVGCTPYTITNDVVVYPTLAVTGSGNSPVCQGGVINLSASYHTGATYTWSGPNGFVTNIQNPSISNAHPTHSGNYTLVVSQPGCGTSSAVVSILVGPSVNGTQVGSNSPVCVGSTLFISATTTSGVNYTWTGPNALTSISSSVSLPSVTSLQSGIYTIRASSPGCQDYVATLAAQVNSPAVPVAGAPGTPYCQGATLDLTVNGTSSMYYSWTGPSGFNSTQQNPRIINSIQSNSGVYSVVVTQPGCGTSSSTVSVVVGPSLSNFVANSNSPVCVGGTLNVSSTQLTGASYTWTGPNSFNSNQSSFSISPVQITDAGNYSVTVVSPGCGTATVRVKVELNNTTGISATTNTPVCAGSVAYLNGSGSRGSTFQWIGPTGFISNTAVATIPNSQVIHGGVYTFIVNDLACGTIQLTTTLQVGANLNSLTLGSNTPVCVGGTLQLSALNGNGATYAWSGPNGFVSAVQFPIINNITTGNSGVYTLTASTPGCLSVTRSMNVLVNPSLTVVPGSNSPVCQGSALYLTGNNVINATYAWAGPNGFSSVNVSPAISNVQTTNAGVYTLTITTIGCGTSSSTTSVGVGGSTGSATAWSNSPICVGNNLVLSVTNVSGATYSWSGPNAFNTVGQFPTVNSVTALNAGQYTVTVSSPGCTPTSRTINVAVNSAITLNAGNTGPVCQGSAVYLSVGSVIGASYAWSGPNGYASTLQNPSLSNSQPTQSGIYTLSVNSPTCGVVTTTTSLTVGSSLNSISVLTNTPVCVGNSLNLTATNRSGFTFSWTGPNGFVSNQAQPVISPATTANAGAYSVVISSAGCGSVTRSTSSVVVNNPSSLVLSSNSPVCVGNVIYFNASGIAGTTYSWSGPGSWTASGTAPARSNAQLSMAGTYTNTATVPGCGVVSNTLNVIVTSCRETQDQNPISGRTETGYEGQESITDANASGAVVSDGLENATLTIWPNPNAGSSVNLKWEGLSADEAEITIRVYDAAGKAVYLKTIQKGDRTAFETSIDFWKVLASGMYTVETVQGKKTLYQKMIVR